MMMKGICYIVGAGEMSSRGLTPKAGDFLIAADGGHQALASLGMRPDIVVGDMDSSTQAPVDIPLLRFPVRKNDTDLSLALKLGRQVGYRRFRLYGAAGGLREDHFLAAIQLMAGRSAKGAKICLVAPRFTLYALTNSSMMIPTRPGQTISVFSHSKHSQGVSLRGLSYCGTNLTLCKDFPLGVSNTAIANFALVSVKKGTLLIYRQE